MAKIFLDFAVHGKFDQVQDVDFGPTTTHKIRYAIADYFTMLSRYVLEPGGFRSSSPVSVSFGATYNANTFGPSANPLAALLPIGWESGATADIDFNAVSPDFPSCPLVGGGPLREDATIVETASFFINVLMQLYSPRSAESGWDTVTHVWLPFDIELDNPWQETYTCDPSMDSGVIASGQVDSNYLGIDYAGGTAFPTATSSLPIGDGTTEVFLLDPGTANKVLITTLDTNNF